MGLELQRVIESENSRLVGELATRELQSQKEKKLTSEINLRNLKLSTLVEQLKKNAEVGVHN